MICKKVVSVARSECDSDTKRSNATENPASEMRIGRNKKDHILKTMMQSDSDSIPTVVQNGLAIWEVLRDTL